jgi:glycosyltransferase involved in cell wall biosynthesis
VVTIHDANYWRLRDFIPAGKRIAASGLCRLSAGACQHIITVSNFSKKEIVDVIGVAAEKVSVVYEGADHWMVAAEREPWEQIARRYDLPERYVVALGGGENRHKNLAALIQAFSKACADMPHALVLAGRTPRGLKEEMAGRGQVKAIGRVPDAELAAIVEHADLFVLPSLYEGFGLPVVEAQSAGTPVACSWAGALPEVAGDGALFFDPYSVDQMASAIRRSLRDEGLRRQLKDRGSRNVMRFSWHDAAEKTLEIYRQAAIRN